MTARPNIQTLCTQHMLSILGCIMIYHPHYIGSSKLNIMPAPPENQPLVVLFVCLLSVCI